MKPETNLRKARREIFPQWTIEEVARQFREFQAGRGLLGVSASGWGNYELGRATQRSIPMMEDVALFIRHSADCIGKPSKRYTRPYLMEVGK